MKMLPVDFTNDEQQNREATKFGDQTRIDPGHCGALSNGEPGRQAEDPRRIRRGYGFSPEARDSCLAATREAGDGDARTVQSLRRGGHPSTHDHLGSCGSHLRQALEASNSDFIGSDGAARTSRARTRDSRGSAEGERRYHRPVAGVGSRSKPPGTPTEHNQHTAAEEYRRPNFRGLE